ncbi:hypothetical protein [Luteibacter yeojuensis]|uniref:Uncharacterized protein n=1 Tax=Luteibacter yeojuensis TaxID=345309 RepID=A0A7X5TP75_9GAMM|nr:hypothetical protein [Luteibacter yeojuensis]NID14493.1 hypothetical protein [Luteibacter yeojuensis]
MPSISLTDLVDVVSRAGTGKAKKVAAIKNRPPYQPQTDFYKALREGIVDVHQKGLGRDALRDIAAHLTDKKKKANYPGAVTGYHKWWGKKTIEWFAPVKTLYTHAGIDVNVNPELGLVIEGQRTLVKLYLKAEPVGKVRIDLVTALMEKVLRPKCRKDDAVALLDVRAGKLFRPGNDIDSTVAMVDAELAYIADLWPKL